MKQLVHHWLVHSGPCVLRAALLKFPTPTIDRNQTVSRRSEPSSRSSLTGEQPDPWKLLHLQDEKSRHRGANPFRRYGRSEKISLLSPG
jgi:hypothetical protein